MRICPLLGDLKFVNIVNSEECFVEAKKNHLDIVKDKRTGSLIWRHSQDGAGYFQQPIFSWKAQWDFFYTTYKRPQNRQDWRAFLIPRDEIPVHWWNTPTIEHGSTWLYWPSNATHSLDEFVINLTSDDLLVRDIVNILETRSLKWGTMKARNPIDMVESLSDIDMDHGEDGGDEDDEAHDYWSSSDYKRGFGSFEHQELRGTTYEVWAAAVVMEICRQRSVTHTLNTLIRFNSVSLVGKSSYLILGPTIQHVVL